MFDIFISMVPSALMIAAPIIIAGLGGFFSERSGVVNIAIEGIMTVGAFVAATVCVLLEADPTFGKYAGWIGVLAGMVAGIIYSSLLAIAAVNLKADQTIAGTALNLLATGLSVYLCQIIFGQQRTQSFTTGISRINKVPILGDIPVIGDMFFNNIYPTIYLAVFLVIVVYIVGYKTAFGLRLRSCGENPHAAASVGINVYKVRWTGVLLSGLFAGIAGGCMVLTSSVQFAYTSIHGTGFIAIAALIFGKWNPWGVLGAGVFFGFSSALGTRASLIPVLNQIPSEFFSCVPYVLTILALVVFSGRSVGPKASGQIYDAGER